MFAILSADFDNVRTFPYYFLAVFTVLLYCRIIDAAVQVQICEPAWVKIVNARILRRCGVTSIWGHAINLPRTFALGQTSHALTANQTARVTPSDNTKNYKIENNGTSQEAPRQAGKASVWESAFVD